MKNNYPIKYGLMPVSEQIGWNKGAYEIERCYDVEGYVISKCYVIGEEKKYLQNGDVKKSYEVVFPLEKNYNDNYYRVEPTFNLIQGHCTNSIVVNDVYDTYELAEEAVNKKNLEILTYQVGSLIYDENFKRRVAELKENHQKKLNNLNEMGDYIDSKTKDLLLEFPKKEQAIIILENGHYKKKDLSLYDFITLFNNTKTNYFVFNVAKEEYQNILKRVAQGKRLDAENIEATYLLKKINSNKIYIYDNNFYDGYYLENNRMYYDEQLDDSLNEDLNMVDDKLKVYTIETFEDIFLSFYPHMVMNHELKDNVMQNVLKRVKK